MSVFVLEAVAVHHTVVYYLYKWQEQVHVKESSVSSERKYIREIV